MLVTVQLPGITTAHPAITEDMLPSPRTWLLLSPSPRTAILLSSPSSFQYTFHRHPVYRSIKPRFHRYLFDLLCLCVAYAKSATTSSPHVLLTGSSDPVRSEKQRVYCILESRLTYIYLCNLYLSLKIASYLFIVHEHGLHSF